MIVTVDGPAGAGKSTAARALARRLGFRLLNTGAMYRAVALKAVRTGLDLADETALGALWRLDRTSGRPGSAGSRGCDHRSPTIGHHRNNSFRRQQSRRAKTAGGIATRDRRKRNVVAEGRDQGTLVSRRECKIFLMAGAVEGPAPAADLQARGETVSLEEVLQQQNVSRCQRSSRSVGPLTAAADAVYFSTDGLSEEAVVDRLEAIRAREDAVGGGGGAHESLSRKRQPLRSRLIHSNGPSFFAEATLV